LTTEEYRVSSECDEKCSRINCEGSCTLSIGEFMICELRSNTVVFYEAQVVTTPFFHLGFEKAVPCRERMKKCLLNFGEEKNVYIFRVK
jgi:hypothetical protein